MQTYIYSSSVIPATAAENFFMRNEKYCLSLRNKLKQDPKSVYFLVKGKICGAFSFSEGGLLLHCLPKFDSSVAVALYNFFSEKSIFCSSGPRPASLLLQKIFLKSQNITPIDARALFLMQGAAPGEKAIDSFGELPPAYFVKECNSSDFEALFPLQTEFFKEEVLPAGQDYNDAVCRINLRDCLEKKHVYALVDAGGKYCCKVCENEVGKKYVLLGGVFTLPEYRNRGLCSSLLRYLIKKNASQNKTCVLFVKTDNLPAIASYKKAGFCSVGDYEVDYWPI